MGHASPCYTVWLNSYVTPIEEHVTHQEMHNDVVESTLPSGSRATTVLLRLSGPKCMASGQNRKWKKWKGYSIDITGYDTIKMVQWKWIGPRTKKGQYHVMRWNNDMDMPIEAMNIMQSKLSNRYFLLLTNKCSLRWDLAEDLSKPTCTWIKWANYLSMLYWRYVVNLIW